MSATGPFSTIRPLKSKIKPTLVPINITTRGNKHNITQQDATERTLGVVVVELISCKCGEIVRNEIR